MSVHLRQENVLKYRKMYKLLVSDVSTPIFAKIHWNCN